MFFLEDYRIQYVEHVREKKYEICSVQNLWLCSVKVIRINISCRDNLLQFMF